MFTHEIIIILRFLHRSSAHIHIHRAVFLEILVKISGVKMTFFPPPRNTVAYILDQNVPISAGRCVRGSEQTDGRRDFYEEQ